MQVWKPEVLSKYIIKLLLETRQRTLGRASALWKRAASGECLWRKSNPWQGCMTCGHSWQGIWVQGGWGAGVPKKGCPRSRGAQGEGRPRGWGSCSLWTGEMIRWQEASILLSPTLPVNKSPMRTGERLFQLHIVKHKLESFWARIQAGLGVAAPVPCSAGFLLPCSPAWLCSSITALPAQAEPGTSGMHGLLFIWVLAFFFFF